MEMPRRQQNILEMLETAGACTYQELGERFNVSMMTIRRDVEELSSKGLVQKVLSGVQKVSAPAYFYESAISTRLAEHSVEKLSIARRAVELLKPGQTVFLDGSTTCLKLAKEIATQMKGLTVVTPSAAVCLELGRQSENTIVGLGGQFDPNSFCFVGPVAEEQAAVFFVDVAFVSTKGFLPGEGTFESAIATFKIKQIIASQALQVVLLVDHSKIGQRALSKVLDVSQLNCVITDAIDKRIQKNLENCGCRVLIARNDERNMKDTECILGQSRK